MSGRVERAIELLPAAGVDAMLVSEIVNVRYLTGYTGSNGLAVVGSDTRAFITDFRYVAQAEEEVDRSFERHRASRDLVDAIAELVPSGRMRLGFEEAHVSVREHARLRQLLPDRIALVGVSGLVEGLRAVKERDEIERIQAASALADESFRQLLSVGLIGRTEREVAIALELDMRARGARRPSFETIVASGPHGALPHAQPRDVEIRRGELVVIDWGAELEGYCSDCTRTIAAGDPGPAARDVYELVLTAQRAGLDAVRPGAGGREVDAVARSVIESGGHGPEFGHGLGHGVGIEVHEAPRLSQRADDELRAGNVVTIEPGVYLPGRFGVRIEDLVALRDGGGEVLTSVEKELTVTD